MTAKPRLVKLDPSLASTFAPEDLSVPKVFTDEHGNCWVKASEFAAWKAAQSAPGITAYAKENHESGTEKIP